MLTLRHSNIQVMPQSDCTPASTNEAQVGSVDRSSLALWQFRVARTERTARTEMTESGSRTPEDGPGTSIHTSTPTTEAQEQDKSQGQKQPSRSYAV